MMARRSFIAAILALAIFPGNASAWMMSLYHETEVKRLHAISGTGNATALRRILKDLGALPGPLDGYQEQLKREMKAMTPTSENAVTMDSLLGLPYAYDNRLRAHVLAQLGLSRLEAAAGQLPEAETHAQLAMDAANMMLQPGVMATAATECYQQLEAVHLQRKSSGKALLAKLHVGLLGDYLASSQGVTDYFLERQLEDDFWTQMYEVNNYMVVVWQQQQAIASQKHARLMAALGAVSSVLSPIAAQKARARGDEAAARQYEFNAITTNLLVQSAQARAAGKELGLSPALNAFGMPILAAQLVDPKMGVSPFGIIKGFAGEAAKLDPALGQAAEGVSQMADALSSTRKKGDPEKTSAGAQDFIKVFTEFQSKVQEIR